MLVKFERPNSGQTFRDVHINPDSVSSLINQCEWCGEVGKRFHLAGYTVVIYAYAGSDGDPAFDVVIGTLDEVAAKLNGAPPAAPGGGR